MSLVAATLLGLAVTDLLRWTPEDASIPRTVWSMVGGAGAVIALAGLSGQAFACVATTCVVGITALVGWALIDRGQRTVSKPGIPLAWIIGVTVVALGLAGSFDPVDGPVGDWHRELPGGLGAGSADAFVLAVAGGLFLLATANRVVRLILQAAGTPASDGEVRLRGGRLLGPMERIIVAGLVVAAEPAGAALVIAAKGLLRFPEIRDSTEGPGERESRQGGRVGPADVTEYFLIGTFASLILAAAVGLLVVAAS